MKFDDHDTLFDRKTATRYFGLINHSTLAVWDCTKRYNLQFKKKIHQNTTQMNS